VITWEAHMSRSTCYRTLTRYCALMLLIAAALSSMPPSRFPRQEKAFDADRALVAFVRPGLVITINSATVGADGTIDTVFSVTDPEAVPLDRLGIETPGPISVSFIAAYIPNGQVQYTSYTTRTASGAVLPSTIQA